MVSGLVVFYCWRVRWNGRAHKHNHTLWNCKNILTRSVDVTTSGFPAAILDFCGCLALSGDVGWCRRHVHLNGRAGKHVSSLRNFSKCLSRNGDLTTSGFRPPYWKWKFTKIVKMSTDCNPRLTAYYGKLTYFIYAISVTTGKNHTIKRKKRKIIGN